jgi:NAD dependent epimerase/dehydratase
LAHQAESGEKHCAVTGAGGFIGSHLVQALLERGCHVRALVHYNGLARQGHLAEVERLGEERQADWRREGRLQIVAGDVQDARCVRELVRGCGRVFHLAALIGIPYSYLAPQAYVNVNVIGALNVLEACREERVVRLIHTSTSEAYGSACYTPMDEDHPLRAQSPYSASKIAADKLVESYEKSFGLPIVTVRPFNVLGPRQSTRAVIPTILSQALAPDCPEIHLGSLDPVRDYTYVEDTVRAFVEIAEAPLEKVRGRLYNVGRGQGISIGELASLALQIVDVRKPIKSDPSRLRPAASEVELLLCDASRLRSELGWAPRYTLEEGLALTAQWIEQHLNRYRLGEYTV